jgi:hypothetical protein
VEVERWNANVLNHQLAEVYQKTVRLVHCTRYIDLDSEFLGKSHAIYSGVNMIVFWASARAYENAWYQKHTPGYGRHSHPWLIPIFARSTDSKRAAAKFIAKLGEEVREK